MVSSKNKIRLIYILLTTSFLIMVGLFILKHADNNKKYDETRTVFIKKSDKGNQLIRNGKPFYIKGAAGNSYFKELSLINGNTIRVYDTLNLASVLDEAERYGLAVIVDIPLPYLTDEKNIHLKQDIKNLVAKHKGHPALLMWNLGNEVYPTTIWKNKYIKVFNDLIDIIHLEDPDHIVGTTIDNKRSAFSIFFHSSKIDIVGINMFGYLEHFNNFKNRIFYAILPIPFYFSEWGNNGHWGWGEQEMTIWNAPIEQTSLKKGEQCYYRYSNFIYPNKKCLGSLIFFWGQKLERTHTWFSIFDEDGNKSHIYYYLESIWNNEPITLKPPQLEYMLLDNKGARDQIIFVPNEIKTAELFYNNAESDILIFKWELIPEICTGEGGMDEKPKTLNNSFIRIMNNKATFIAPKEEGPYRIFVYIYDQNGNFATTNTPFYVLSNK